MEHVNGTEQMKGGAEELAIPEHINGARRQTRNGRFMPPGNQEARARAVATLAVDVKPERTEWLWKDRIPLGALVMLDGDPSNGKSALTCDLAARVSRGLPMPDGSPGLLGGVVMANLEDHHSTTIAPRLIAARADRSKVLLWSAVEDENGERLPSIPEDVAQLEGLVQQVGARLVVVDPLMAILPSEVNSYRDQDVRRALAPLAKMAERTGCAVLVVRHLTKQPGGSAMYRGGGSIGIIGAARAGLMVGKDPRDPERRVLAITKTNLGPDGGGSIGYRLVGSEVEGAGEVVRVEWTGSVSVSAQQLVAVPADQESSPRDSAAEWLTELLSEGSIAVSELKEQAKSAGHSWRTIERAKEALPVKVARRGFGAHGQWEWSLSNAGQNRAEPIHRHTPPHTDMAAFGGVCSAEPAASVSAPESETRGGLWDGPPALDEGDPGPGDADAPSEPEAAASAEPEAF